VTVNYGAGQNQVAVPVFAEIPTVLEHVRGLPGVNPNPMLTNATLEGLVEVSMSDGTRLRARPHFEVTSGHPAGAKRIIVEGDGSRAFDFGDGRRQRFRIVP
jgi:hypothetical protein